VAEPSQTEPFETYATLYVYRDDSFANDVATSVDKGTWHSLADMIINTRSGKGAVGRFFFTCLCNTIVPYLLELEHHPELRLRQRVPAQFFKAWRRFERCVFGLLSTA
jgi:hypothetical protein